MALRFRLIAMVAVALAVSLALGGVVTLFNASRSVQTEMRSALLVAQHTVDNLVRGLDASPHPQHDLDELVASFSGSRHLRVSLTGGATAAQVQPVRDHYPFGGVPRWFVRLVGIAPETDRVPIAIGGQSFGTLVIETDPRNEIREVWNELTGSLVMLALFAGGTMPLIYWVIGRALRPLGRLAEAMRHVGRGDYAIRVSDRLPLELARLGESFNRMASRLAATNADNHRLHEQLMTLQEEERNEIARDLHDEIGPLLFAINVDAANLTRLLDEGRADELPPHAKSITDAARRLQREVRGMLGRLRPTGLAEFGLAEAVNGLAAFWRRRYPEIDFRIAVSPSCETLGDPIDTTIYRIVQECLSNAVRHGRPEAIAVTVARDGASGDVTVEVADDGIGADAEPAPGYGLIGMEERVRAIGGGLRFANRTGGGFAVVASLPWPLPATLPAAPPSPPLAEAAQ